MGWSLDLPILDSFRGGKIIVRLVWRLHFLPDGDQFGAQHDGSGNIKMHHDGGQVVTATIFWLMERFVGVGWIICEVQIPCLDFRSIW